LDSARVAYDCNYIFSSDDVDVKWIHQILEVRKSVDAEITSDIVFNASGLPEQKESVIGIVQAGLVFSSNIESLQESLLDEKDLCNQMIKGIEKNRYEVASRSERLLRFSRGKNVDWVSRRMEYVKVLCNDAIRTEVWPDCPQLIQIVASKFSKVNEANLVHEFEHNFEFREYLLRMTPFTIIEVHIPHETGSGALRIRWKARNVAAEFPHNNFVYNIFGPKNVWMKVKQKIDESSLSPQWKGIFREKYDDSTQKIRASMYDVEIVVDPSLSEFITHGQELAAPSRLETWSFSEPSLAWVHHFPLSFERQEKDILIGLKAVVLGPIIERIVLDVDTSSIIDQICRNQIEELAENVSMPPEDAKEFEESIDRIVEEEIRRAGLRPTEEAKRMLRNFVIYSYNRIMDET
jgi:hypothetical protein